MLSTDHIYVFLINMSFAFVAVYQALRLHRMSQINRAITGLSKGDIENHFSPRGLTSSSPIYSVMILSGFYFSVCWMTYDQVGYMAGMTTLLTGPSSLHPLVIIGLHCLYVGIGLATCLFSVGVILMFAEVNNYEDDELGGLYLFLAVGCYCIVNLFAFNAPLSLLLLSILAGALAGVITLCCRYPMKKKYYAILKLQTTRKVYPIVNIAEHMEADEKDNYFLDAMTTLCIQQRWVCLALLTKMAPDTSERDKWKVMVTGGLKGYFSLANSVSDLDERFHRLPEELHDFARPVYAKALSKGLSEK